MSRRAKRAERRPDESADLGAAPQRRAGEAADPGGPSQRRRALAGQIGLLVVVFAVATLIAELAGAANLGVALGVGQIAFAITLVALMVWR
jgi:hypothetical protein